MSSKSAREFGRPWSVALRLTVWYAATALALMFSAAAFLYWGMVQNLDREDDLFLADKINVIRRVIETHPTDRTALEREVSPGGSGLTYIRIIPSGDTRGTLETPGMNSILPDGAFPTGEGAPPFVRPGEYRTDGGKSFRTRTYRERGQPYCIQVAMDTSHDDDLLADYRKQLAYVLGSSLVAAVLGGHWLARRGLRPIADMTATARRIGPTHLGERIATPGLPAEVRDLADTFNLMLDRIEESFVRLDRFSADIAHELRTPVNNLRGEAEVALSRPRPPEEYREVLGSCLEESERLVRLIDGLLFLARVDNPKAAILRSSIDVAVELRAVRDVFGPTAADVGVELRLEVETDLVLRADRDLIHRAVGNLVSNALAHTPAGGTVTLFAHRDAEAVRVGVRDTGTGIPSKHLPFVFDRFYRADSARSYREGRIGLGLAIVRGVAELHGGSAFASSPPGQGTTMTITLPVEGD